MWEIKCQVLDDILWKVLILKSNKKKAIVLVVLVVWILIAISLTAYYSAKNKDAIKEVAKIRKLNKNLVYEEYHKK